MSKCISSEHEHTEYGENASSCNSSSDPYDSTMSLASSSGEIFDDAGSSDSDDNNKYISSHHNNNIVQTIITDRDVHARCSECGAGLFINVIKIQHI